jgi:hypothetical protein
MFELEHTISLRQCFRTQWFFIHESSTPPVTPGRNKYQFISQLLSLHVDTIRLIKSYFTRSLSNSTLHYEFISCLFSSLISETHMSELASLICYFQLGCNEMRALLFHFGLR